MGDLKGNRRRDSVDPALVEAIAQNVARQLRTFSMSKYSGEQRCRGSTSRGVSADSYALPSRTSSQQNALGRFTHDLGRYAEDIRAEGRVPVFTPTPAPSAATCRTISALMPFRTEFRAAGLAVTSEDQTRRFSAPFRNAYSSRTGGMTRRSNEGSHSLVSQLDGKAKSNLASEQYSLHSVNPNMAADANGYAQEHQIPTLRSRNKPQRTMSRCFPCLPGIGNDLTEREWRHLQPSFSNFTSGLSSRYPRGTLSPRGPGRIPRSAPPGINVLPSHPLHRSWSSIPSVERRVFWEQPRAFFQPRLPVRPAGYRHPAKPSRPPPMAPPGGRMPDAGYHGRTMRSEQSLLSHLTNDAAHPRRTCASQNVYPPYQKAQVTHNTQHLESLRPQKTKSSPGLSLSPAHMFEITAAAKGREFGMEKNVGEGGTGSLGQSTKMPQISRRSSVHADTEKAARDYHKSEAACRPSNGPPVVPRRTSSLHGSLHKAFPPRHKGDRADRDVLRGLSVLIAAACNDRTETVPGSESSVQIRRFLAGLVVEGDTSVSVGVSNNFKEKGGWPR